MSAQTTDDKELAIIDALIELSGQRVREGKFIEATQSLALASRAVHELAKMEGRAGRMTNNQ